MTDTEYFYEIFEKKFVDSNNPNKFIWMAPECNPCFLTRENAETALKYIKSRRRAEYTIEKYKQLRSTWFGMPFAVARNELEMIFEVQYEKGGNYFCFPGDPYFLTADEAQIALERIVIAINEKEEEKTAIVNFKVVKCIFKDGILVRKEEKVNHNF